MTTASFSCICGCARQLIVKVQVSGCTIQWLPFTGSRSSAMHLYDEIQLGHTDCNVLRAILADRLALDTGAKP